jgi:hypothetical protein
MKVPEISNKLNNKINEQLQGLKYHVLRPGSEGDLENERCSLQCTIHKTGNVQTT